MNKKILPPLITTLLLIIILGLYFSFIFDIGINSKYFVKRDFTNAFLARKTGDCTVFKGYIYTERDKWGERCIAEKNIDNPPIEEFNIKDITVHENLAFLQVELKRGVVPLIGELSKETIELIQKGYVVNYDLMKDNSQKSLFIFPITRWLIKNEYK